MSNQKIVTIGRQFGSGGHEIGNALAQRLNIPLYDQNLVKMAAEQLKISPETVAAVDERELDRFLSSYMNLPGGYTSYYMGDVEFTPPLSVQVQEVQSELIRRLAERGPCIFVGRCADYLLRDNPNCLNVFICAAKEDRIRRIAEKYDLSEKKAADKIKRIDRERKYYYETCTGQEWGSTSSHQILLNVSMLGMEKTVDLLEALYMKK